MHSLIWQILPLTVFSPLILLTFLLSLRILCREGERMPFFPPASKTVYQIAKSHCQSWLFVVLHISRDLLALVAGGEDCEPGHKSKAMQGPCQSVEPNASAGATAWPLARSGGPGLQ